MKYIFLTLFIFSISFTQKQKVPTFTKAELKQLIASKRPFLLVDARKEKDFKDGHIKGAVNQYARARALDPMFDDLNKIEQLFVIYCQSKECPYADELAYRLLQKGFVKILVYHGGYADWLIK